MCPGPERARGPGRAYYAPGADGARGGGSIAEAEGPLLSMEARCFACYDATARRTAPAAAT
jgi:hypothetical protein